MRVALRHDRGELINCAGKAALLPCLQQHAASLAKQAPHVRERRIALAARIALRIARAGADRRLDDEFRASVALQEIFETENGLLPSDAAAVLSSNSLLRPGDRLSALRCERASAAC